MLSSQQAVSQHFFSTVEIILAQTSLETYETSHFTPSFTVLRT
jgi:hypothetical protein